MNANSSLYNNVKPDKQEGLDDLESTAGTCVGETWLSQWDHVIMTTEDNQGTAPEVVIISALMYPRSHVKGTEETHVFGVRYKNYEAWR